MFVIRFTRVHGEEQPPAVGSPSTEDTHEKSVNEVKAWFADPANSQIISTQRQFMTDCLNRGIPWHDVRVMAEGNYLRNLYALSDQGVYSEQVRKAWERVELARAELAEKEAEQENLQLENKIRGGGTPRTTHGTITYTPASTESAPAP